MIEFGSHRPIERTEPLCFGIGQGTTPGEPAFANGSEADNSVGEFVTQPAAFLLPGDYLRSALDRFSQAAQETLPVIDNTKDRRILGYLSEAYALRRYAQELERHRGGRQDDAGIFSPAAGDAPPNPQQP